MSGFRSRSRRSVQQEKEQAKRRQRVERPAREERPDVDEPRLAAFDVLTQVREEDAYANLVLPV